MLGTPANSRPHAPLVASEGQAPTAFETLARGNKGEPGSSFAYLCSLPPHCNMPPTSTRVGGRTNKHVALLGITNRRSRKAQPRNPTSCQLRSVLSPWVPHVGT